MKKVQTQKNKIDLMKDLNEKILSLRNIRFGIAGSKSKNVKDQRNIKRDIARIKTALNGINL